VVLILVMQSIAHRFEGKIDEGRVEQTGIV